MKNDYQINASFLLEALDALEEGVVVYNADGYLMYCNRMFQDLYGYSDEDVEAGVHFQELGRIDLERGNVVIGDEVGGGEAYLERKRRYRESLNGSFIVQLEDGRWIKTTDRRLPHGGFVSIQTDVTDLKRSQTALQERNESLEMANRAKTLFFASMSHELRTPLNAIIGFADLIHSEVWGPINNDHYENYVGDIQRSGRLLLDIINNVLIYSNLETNERAVEVSPTALSPIVEECLAIIQVQAHNRGIALSSSDAIRNLEVLGEEQALKQILLNLLSNAIKYSDPADQVLVDASRSKDLSEITVTITDTGQGMSEAQIRAVGEPFVGHEGSVARHEQGSGLGLAICKRLVEAMGGRLEIKSTLKVGTEVRAVLRATTGHPMRE